MKNKTVILIFSLIAFVSICFTSCENFIISQWWEDEPEYIPLLKYIPQVTYETMIQEKIVYQTVFQQLPPEIITEYVYVQLPPEVLIKIETVIQYVPTPPNEVDIINWLKDPANEDKVKEIIKKIPPKIIMNYLTDEQIQYIVSQQPPERIFQSIRIIGIEYIIFAGDSSTVNGPPGPSANSVLTAQEMAYNTSVIKTMAQLLSDNPTYIAMLHGHANPTQFTDGETLDLKTLSINRANDVRRVLLAEYNKLTPAPGSPAFNDRVSTSGYGGEKVLFGGNTQYTALNRRVEMILFEIITTVQ